MYSFLLHRAAAMPPGTRIVINHAGMPSDRSEDGLRAWRTALAAMAAQPNVAIKISGSAQERAQLFVENARRIYRIPV
jgi:predicted TIM-barrel fold metal-dependent hydrolase